ncbi:hypothetical protein [Streptomyces sp. NPDC056056]|uniref:hypothetical protein n=1 Tax=unclassified Streptomyces TaxID=2593676 RepID=UPI0035D964E7
MKRTVRGLLVFGSVLGLGVATGGPVQAAPKPGERVCYQAHVADYGWLPEKCQGGQVGVTGQNKAIERMRITISGLGRFCASAHIRNIGDGQGERCANSGQTVTVGTEGMALPMEELMVWTDSLGALHGRAHVQNVGWKDPVVAFPTMWLGTRGQARNLEAIEMWIE